MYHILQRYINYNAVLTLTWSQLATLACSEASARTANGLSFSSIRFRSFSKNSLPSARTHYLR